MLNKVLVPLVSIVTLLGAAFAWDGRLAKKEPVEARFAMIEKAFVDYQKAQRRFDIQKRIDIIKERHMMVVNSIEVWKPNTANTTKEEYRNLKDELSR